MLRKSNSVQQTLTVPTSTKTPEPTATRKPEYYLGDTVLKNGYGLTAVSIIDPYNTKVSYPRDTSKKLIGVNVVISNISGIPFDFLNTGSSVQINDIDGFVYPMFNLSDSMLWFLLSLHPGEKINRIFAFEVPLDFQPNIVTIPIRILGGFDSLTISGNLRNPPEGHVSLSLINGQTTSRNLPSIGTPVSGFDSSITVLDYNPSAQPTYYINSVGSKYVAVQIEVENVSSADTLEASNSRVYLIDNEGFIYQSTHDIAGGLKNTSLLAGGKTKGWVIFMVPKNVNPIGIKYKLYHPLAFVSDDYLFAGLSQ